MHKADIEKILGSYDEFMENEFSKHFLNAIATHVITTMGRLSNEDDPTMMFRFQGQVNAYDDVCKMPKRLLANLEAELAQLTVMEATDGSDKTD